MPRLLALADTQLGVSTVDLADQAAVLDRIADVAIERKVDLVLHGGDVYEGRTSGIGHLITPEQQRVFLDFVARLREARISTLALTGNGVHDLAQRAVHGLDVLHEVPGIAVADSPNVYALGGFNVCALPWVSTANILARMNGAVDHDAAAQTAADLLVRIAEELHRGAREVHPDLPTILICHFAISGSKLPTGLSVDQMREPVLSWADLDAIGYDCIIGAHVHEPQQISQPLIDQTLGFVVGSPQQLSFGERGEHGVWIVDIVEHKAGNAVSAEFVPIASRQFHTFTVTDAVGLDGLAECFIGWDVPDGAIVRVRYQASEEDARRIDHEALRRAYLAAGASRVTIEPQIVREARARAEGVSEEISPGEALAAWCETQDVSSELAQRMLATLKVWRS